MVEQKSALAKPMLIVSPTYPPNAVAEGRTAELKIRGTITTDGKLESPVFSTAPGDEAFTHAVRQVLEAWRFVPGIDRDACAAVPMQAEVRVSFEIKEGKPAIFVSIPPAEEYPAAKDPAKRLVKLSHQPRTGFPRDAVRKGIEGHAYVLARIEKSGEVSHVNLLSSTPLHVFGDEAVRAMRQARYEVFNPDAWEKDFLCGQIEFDFCLGSDAVYRVPQCRSKR